MLKCIIPEAKHCKVYISKDSLFLIKLENLSLSLSLLEDKQNELTFFLIKLENASLSLSFLEDKQNVKFGGFLISVNHASNFSMFFMCLCNLNARFTPIS